MSFRYSPIRNNRTLAAMLLFFFISISSTISFSAEIPVVIAQGGSKSSGNEILKAVEGGAELKDMTKQQIIAAYGEPWQKDTTGEKGRYDEKWTYSCETHNGLTYDCVYLYFMADRVVDVGNF
jgi:hypothetical protein